LRRAYELVAVEAEVAETLVIADDQQNIGFTFCSRLVGRV
jgi:hypothetical protein